MLPKFADPPENDPPRGVVGGFCCDLGVVGEARDGNAAEKSQAAVAAENSIASANLRGVCGLGEALGVVGAKSGSAPIALPAFGGEAAASHTAWPMAPATAIAAVVSFSGVCLLTDTGAGRRAPPAAGVDGFAGIVGAAGATGEKPSEGGLVAATSRELGRAGRRDVGDVGGGRGVGAAAAAGEVVVTLAALASGSCIPSPFCDDAEGRTLLRGCSPLLVAGGMGDTGKRVLVLLQLAVTCWGDEKAAAVRRALATKRSACIVLH